MSLKKTGTIETEANELLRQNEILKAMIKTKLKIMFKSMFKLCSQPCSIK